MLAELNTALQEEILIRETHQNKMLLRLYKVQLFSSVLSKICLHHVLCTTDIFWTWQMLDI